MPDVRLPDGTIVKNVPEGTTQSELMRRLGKAAVPNPLGIPASQLNMSMGPATESFQDPLTAELSKATGPAKALPPSFTAPFSNNPEVAAGVAAGDEQIPLLQSEAFHEKSIPVVGGMAGMLVPGAGWGALALQSLMSGLGGGTGEMVRQKLTREPPNFKAAATTGAQTAAANFAGGATIKGLGALSKKLFSSPLSEPQQAAAEFARTEGAPFPLSSAAPGSGAARTQQTTRVLLPGEIKTQLDANRVAQFLNNRVATIVDSASPVDEAALSGQQYLRQVFEPGETVYTETFQKLRSAVGDDTAVPLTNTRAAMESVTEALKARGETKSVFNRFRNVLSAGAPEQTVAQLDELYSGILKDTARNANARREANVVLSAIAKDIDGVSQQFGVSFADDIAKAKVARDQFRELRNIPQLERLSKDFGDKGGALGSRQWMSEMFANPNGKALAELRAKNPELYHELADSWLASNINRFSRPTESSIGRVLDGQKLRAWFEQNESSLKLIYGAPQAKALDNFTNYAAHMSGAVSRANAGSKGLDPTALLFRGGAELASVAKFPALMIPGESASYVLAKGLSDPNSQLFKVFTEGFSPTTRAVMRRSGQLAGQGAVDATKDTR